MEISNGKNKRTNGQYDRPIQEQDAHKNHRSSKCVFLFALCPTSNRLAADRLFVWIVKPAD
jgi:hypothetical protein